MDEFIERRKFPAEEAFTKLLEEHIADSEVYKTHTTATLEALRKEIKELTASTAEVLEAYETAQQALKFSIGFGKLLKYIGGLVLLYYSIITVIPPHK